MDHCLELVVRDIVIPTLLRHLHKLTDPRFIHPTPSFVGVLPTINICRSWREGIDVFMEAKTLHLAHQDLSQNIVQETINRWINDKKVYSDPLRGRMSSLLKVLEAQGQWRTFASTPNHYSSSPSWSLSNLVTNCKTTVMRTSRFFVEISNYC